MGRAQVLLKLGEEASVLLPASGGSWLVAEPLPSLSPSSPGLRPGCLSSHDLPSSYKAPVTLDSRPALF